MCKFGVDISVPYVSLLMLLMLLNYVLNFKKTEAGI